MKPAFSLIASLAFRVARRDHLTWARSAPVIASALLVGAVAASGCGSSAPTDSATTEQAYSTGACNSATTCADCTELLYCGWCDGRCIEGGLNMPECKSWAYIPGQCGGGASSGGASSGGGGETTTCTFKCSSGPAGGFWVNTLSVSSREAALDAFASDIAACTPELVRQYASATKGWSVSCVAGTSRTATFTCGADDAGTGYDRHACVYGGGSFESTEFGEESPYCRPPQHGGFGHLEICRF